MTTQEDEYYSQRRCGTCKWHCKNCKLDLPLSERRGITPPWVCGNENCSSFARSKKDDAGGACTKWEKRNVLEWLTLYNKLRLCKRHNKSRSFKTRNLDVLRYDICKSFSKTRTHYISDTGAIHAIAYYHGISMEDVRWCLDRGGVKYNG